MNQAFIASAIDRLQTARYAKGPEFQIEVEYALKEALTQPFGEPLAVARVHSRSPVLARRAVWSAVVRRLEAEPDLLASKPLTKAQHVRPEPPVLNGEFQYEVGLMTEAGPGSPATLLKTLAKNGLARVHVFWTTPKSPSLIYTLPEEHAAPELDGLRLSKAPSSCGED